MTSADCRLQRLLSICGITDILNCWKQSNLEAIFHEPLVNWGHGKYQRFSFHISVINILEIISQVQQTEPQNIRRNPSFRSQTLTDLKRFPKVPRKLNMLHRPCPFWTWLTNQKHIKNTSLIKSPWGFPRNQPALSAARMKTRACNHERFLLPTITENIRLFLQGVSWMRLLLSASTTKPVTGQPASRRTP